MKLLLPGIITLLLFVNFRSFGDQALNAANQKTALKGKLLLPGNRPVNNMAIVLTPLDKQTLSVPRELVVEIRNKKIFPSVAVIPKQQIVRICHGQENKNAANHNIYSPGPLFPFDMGILKKGDTTGKTIQNIPPGKLDIYCSMYQSIKGHYLIVKENQRGVSIGKDGDFEMPDLPPGKYKISVWQSEKRYQDSVTHCELPLDNRLQIELFRSVPTQ